MSVGSCSCSSNCEVRQSYDSSDEVEATNFFNMIHEARQCASVSSGVLLFAMTKSLEEHLFQDTALGILKCLLRSLYLNDRSHPSWRRLSSYTTEPSSTVLSISSIKGALARSRISYLRPEIRSPRRNPKSTSHHSSSRSKARNDFGELLKESKCYRLQWESYDDCQRDGALDREVDRWRVDCEA